jgi:bifunctional non-homologous end joining protein LigD
MLVSPATLLPAGEEWAFEVKWDGMRALVCVDPAVQVHSRHGHDHTAAFPELAALDTLAGRARVVLDGKLVCFDPATGRPSFERLMARVQARLPAVAARQAPATFGAFDVLAVDGDDVCGRPWAERRQLLDELHDLAPGDMWRVNTAFVDGPGLLAATAGMGLEGVVAKRVTSRYLPGRQLRMVRAAGLAGAGRPGPGWAAGRAGRPGDCLRLPGPAGGRAAAVRRPGRRTRGRGPGRGAAAGPRGRGRGRLPGAVGGRPAARTGGLRRPGYRK